MKKVLAVVALLALLVVGDRFAASYAADRLATELQAGAGLATAPTVEITGFPFLTQALGGRYDRIEVGAVDVAAGEARLDRLDATLTGVEVPLSQALSGQVEQVPAERVEAAVRLSYASLARSSGDRRLTVTPEGDRVRVTGEVDVLGQTVAASALSRVELDGDSVRVTAQEFRVGNELADRLLTRTLGDRFDLRVRVQDLPYGLEVQGLRVEPDAIVVTSAADDVLLSTRVR